MSRKRTMEGIATNTCFKIKWTCCSNKMLTLYCLCLCAVLSLQFITSRQSAILPVCCNIYVWTWSSFNQILIYDILCLTCFFAFLFSTESLTLLQSESRPLVRFIHNHFITGCHSEHVWPVYVRLVVGSCTAIKKNEWSKRFLMRINSLMKLKCVDMMGSIAINQCHS